MEQLGDLFNGLHVVGWLGNSLRLLLLRNQKLPMTLVSLYAYINPIVAVLLGWLVLNEKLNLRIGLAIVVTIVGIYIVNKGYQLKVFKKTQAVT